MEGKQHTCSPLPPAISMESTKRKKRAHSVSSTGSNSGRHPTKKKRGSAKSGQQEGAAQINSRSVTIKEIPDEGDNPPASADKRHVAARDSQAQPSASKPAQPSASKPAQLTQELEAKKG